MEDDSANRRRVVRHKIGTLLSLRDLRDRHRTALQNA
jgi:hypothetical protein